MLGRGHTGRRKDCLYLNPYRRIKTTKWAANQSFMDVGFVFRLWCCGPPSPHYGVFVLGLAVLRGSRNHWGFHATPSERCGCVGPTNLYRARYRKVLKSGSFDLVRSRLKGPRAMGVGVEQAGDGPSGSENHSTGLAWHGCAHWRT